VSFVDLRRAPGALLRDLPPAASVRESPQRPNYREELRWLLERLDRREPIRIRCGGDRYLDSKNIAWEKDRFFERGDCSIVAAGDWLASDVRGTDDTPLYVSYRSFDGESAGTSGYHVPLPPGRYRVGLHFAEVWTSQSGVRVFDVLLEGKPVIADYDLVQAVGFAHADVKRFAVEVTDGVLDIDFLAKRNRAMISAIEIEPQ